MPQIQRTVRSKKGFEIRRVHNTMPRENHGHLSVKRCSLSVVL